jgi:hypothetical protein
MSILLAKNNMGCEGGVRVSMVRCEEAGGSGRARVPWPWCPHAAAGGQAPPDCGRVRIETICQFR